MVKASLLIISACLLFFIHDVQAHMVGENAHISGPVGASTTAAIYIDDLHNHSEQARIITRLGIPEMPQARVEIHIIEEDDAGIVRMRKRDSLSMAAHEHIKLSPNGTHIMVFNVDKEKLGGAISLVMHFDDGTQEAIDVYVGNDHTPQQTHHH